MRGSLGLGGYSGAQIGVLNLRFLLDIRVEMTVGYVEGIQGEVGLEI